jgi:DNA-binding MarR family transcriptional regulator
MSAPRLVEPASIDDLLLYRIGHLLASAGSMVIRLCEGRFGITRREWRILALLAREEGLGSSQLAERAHLDRARTSRAITSLVAKKMVLRETAPGDRRHARLALTPAGRSLYEQLFPLVREINVRLLAPLASGDAGELDRHLDALQGQADRMVQQAQLPKADRRRGGRTRRALG